jgi:hypothetical protein
MAAHILLNLDPESTEHPSRGEGWLCYWLYAGADFPTEFAQRPGSSSALYTRDDALSVAFARIMRLTALADPLKVRTPEQWLAWAEENDLVPEWLAAGAASYGGRDLSKTSVIRAAKTPNPV